MRLPPAEPGASFCEPLKAAGDGSVGDDRFFHDWGMVAECERRYSIGAHPGVVRPLAFVNQGEFGSYKAALSIPGSDISKTYANRHTFGFGLNAEQDISKNIGVFSRVGWNDGHNEAWIYTDIDHSGSQAFLWVVLGEIMVSCIIS